MKNLLLAALMLSASFTFTDSKKFRHFKEYAGMTYNILQSYSDLNPNASSSDIRLHLNEAKPIFKDANEMGYTRTLILRSTYCLALDVEPRNEKILEALRLELMAYNMWHQVLYYTSLGCTAFCTVTSLSLIPMVCRMYKDFLTQ